MNSKHLGDAYDYVKKELLKSQINRSRKVLVFPMFTDELSEEQCQYYTEIVQTSAYESTKVFTNFTKSCPG